MADFLFETFLPVKEDSLNVSMCILVVGFCSSGGGGGVLTGVNIKMSILILSSAIEVACDQALPRCSLREIMRYFLCFLCSALVLKPS